MGIDLNDIKASSRTLTNTRNDIKLLLNNTRNDPSLITCLRSYSNG